MAKSRCRILRPQKGTESHRKLSFCEILRASVAKSRCRTKGSLHAALAGLPRRTESAAGAARGVGSVVEWGMGGSHD